MFPPIYDCHVIMFRMWNAAPTPADYYRWLARYQSPEWFSACARWEQGYRMER